MDFLETDFHKRKAPRRAITLRNPDNLLVGIRLNKYPSFNALTWKLINTSFKEGVVKSLQKGVYHATVPQNLIDLVTRQVEKLEKKKIDDLVLELAESVEALAISYRDEITKANDESLEVVTKLITQKVVEPFIHSIEKPLQSLNLADENNLYIMTEDLTGILVNLVEGKISDIVNSIAMEDKVNARKELSSVLNLDTTKENILTFFDEFKVNDLFSEVYEMERNKSILDKQEFYLYFGDITFNKAKYPIFYVPFNVERRGEVLDIKFDSQVYINKKSLEYIVQEYNTTTGKKGSLASIKDRIIYLAQHQEDFPKLVDDILDELRNFFDLNARIDINNPKTQIAKSAHTRISNEVYIALFDKSDEALINDYEEILGLEEDSELFGALTELINNYVTVSPRSFWEEISDKWDSLETSEKLVFQSPIPLNSEQLKILMALNKDDCNYIAVEGPPGTGKSHTITAIVFNAILDNKSVLVLSDKKEALDVVEDKITETMNAVRIDNSFQNPILRLGKSGNTYKQILSPASVEKIKTQYRVVRKDLDGLESNISQSLKGLKEDIEADVVSGAKINLLEIAELINLESYVNQEIKFVDVPELLASKNSFIDMEELRASLNRIDQLLSGSHTTSQLLIAIDLNPKDNLSFSEVKSSVAFLIQIYNHAKTLKDSFEGSNSLESMCLFREFSENNYQKLGSFIDRYKSIRMPLIGFMLNQAKASEIDLEFSQHFQTTYSDGHNHIAALEKVYASYGTIKRYVDEQLELSTHKVDYLKIMSWLFQSDTMNLFEEVLSLGKDADYIDAVVATYPLTATKSGLENSSSKVSSNRILRANEVEFNKLLRYLSLNQKLSDSFNAMPVYSYSDQKSNIEKLVTTKMTYLMDESVINFQENNRDTAKVLKDIITAKEKFPREEFLKLKKAFPCILSGIRDYAEYIPLDHGLFDLVIIDEASQVSIAQAFPALLRAKKVLILGDRLQFGNVKANQAKSDINTEYLNDLRDVFEENVSSDLGSLKKLEYFNIKKSVLDFFEFINNYQSMLVKHFRGYKENISFSNKFFYQDQLQVMKIRGKSIDDVIKISIVEHDGKKEIRPNTNMPEINFIIDQLRLIKESGINQSVGIITPHTNQQKLIFETINKLPERDFYFENFKLKVMTFDTCQGEERDVIFYSMVATKDDDKLTHIFPKDLHGRDAESDDENLRSQRMNVGFSRTKECLHLVLSKPVEEYRGAIRDALLHYASIIEDAKKEKSVEEVDQNSPMEKSVLNWFYQTNFWKKNKDSIELNPQFEIGKYLKQLDPAYTHPNYKVDFLLTYTDEAGKQKKLIIEYDGFEEHFKNLENVDQFNYEDYYSDDDVYRQKVLESYKYVFLRINKFNMGANPIETLDKRIAAALTNSGGENKFVANMTRTIQGLQNGEMKECPKCTEFKPLDAFKDDTLASGYGRFCKVCKQKPFKFDPVANSSAGTCPKCSSVMVLRSGRYGQFYGCSRFPYCKTTKPLVEVSV